MALVHRVGWQPAFIQRNRWFWPLTRAARRFEQHLDWPSVKDFDALYAELAPSDVSALRFGSNVRKRDKRVGGRVVLDALYDARITLHGEVPSRERDWHDFFNALCFATFPRAKLALHARQYRILEQRVGHDAERLPGARTREQDALTLFDEGGVVVALTPTAHAALLALDKPQREQHLLQLAAGPVHDAHALEREAVIVPFGHALFEHLIEDLRCPGGCTQLIVLPQLPMQDHALLDAVDRALALSLLDPTRFVGPKDCSQVVLSLR